MNIDYHIYKNGEYWFIIITTNYNCIIVTFVINNKKVENIKQINTAIPDYKRRLTEYIETFLKEFQTFKNNTNTVLVNNEDAPDFVINKIMRVLDKLKKEWIKNEEI